MRVDVILDPGTSPWEVKELGLLAEGYGINAVWSSNYPSSRDAFLTLAPLALASTRIRLGPLVVTAYEQHPFKTAKALGLALPQRSAIPSDRRAPQRTSSGVNK